MSVKMNITVEPLLARAPFGEPVESTREGWGFPELCRVEHYFEGLYSLCGKWMYGGRLFPAPDAPSAQCRSCSRKLGKKRA